MLRASGAQLKLDSKSKSTFAVITFGVPQLALTVLLEKVITFGVSREAPADLLEKVVPSDLIEYQNFCPLIFMGIRVCAGYVLNHVFCILGCYVLVEIKSLVTVEDNK